MLGLLQNLDDQYNLDEIQAYLLFFADDKRGPPGPVGAPIFILSSTSYFCAPFTLERIARSLQEWQPMKPYLM
jgi:hypothetical protein